MTYQVFGTPGPWWRDNAMRPDFDRDSAECMRESKAARENAEDAQEAAYRSFIECMEKHGWKRGTAPPVLPPV